MEEIVKKIVEQVFNVSPVSINEIVDKGKNNSVFKIELDDNSVILRMRNSKEELETYKKEKWCAKGAKNLGILTPEILEVGVYENYAFSFQEFIDGTHGTDAEDQKEKIWFTLGQYAKSFNQIPAEEIGLDYQSKIEGLFDNNFFVVEGIFSPELSTKIKNRLIETIKWKFSPKLSHGNLSDNNVLIDKQNNIWLIDWETATGNRSPHADLAEIYTWNTGKEYISAFCEGYELSPTDIDLMMRDIQTLILLRIVDVIKRRFPKDGNWRDDKYTVETARNLGEMDNFENDILFTKNL